MKRLKWKLGGITRDGSPVLRHLALLVGGTAVAQGILVLASPLLSRLFSPEEFGLFTIYTSLTSILAVVASGRYELAIPLPEDDLSAANLLALSLVVLAGTSWAIMFGVWYVGPMIAQLFAEEGLTQYLWYLPGSLLGTGAYQALNYWATRKRLFDSSARAKLWQALGQVGTQLGTGVLRQGPFGLVLGDIVGRVGAATALATSVWDRKVFGMVSFPRMLEVAKHYVRFPLLTAWSTLLNTASVQVPTLLIGAVFDKAVVGWFGLSYRVLQLPMTFVGQAVTQVFFSHASSAYHEGNLARTTAMAFRNLVGVGLGPILLLGIVAPQLFEVVFGVEWGSAGLFAQWISPWLFFVFVASPLSSLVFVLGHQGTELVFQATILGGRLAAIYAGWRLGNPYLSIGLFGLVSGVLWFAYTLWLIKISGNSVRWALWLLAGELGVTLAQLVPVLVARAISVDAWILFAASGVSVVLMAVRVVAKMGRFRNEGSPTPH